MSYPTKLNRRHSIRVKVGPVQIERSSPIVIQSMTNTDTGDLDSTVAQIMRLQQAGSELVRITVDRSEAAEAVPRIRDKLDRLGCFVPLIGDFHYNGHSLLKNYPSCASSLAKYRINPGNVGFGEKKDHQFSQIIEVAIDHKKPIRIGVNWGSLDGALLTRLMNDNQKKVRPKSSKEILHEAIVESALTSANYARLLGMPEENIILSAKVSKIQDLIAVNQLLAQKCSYALHLGLTEAGMDTRGIVSSSAALAILLNQGIGDTIRISLTPDPNGDRTKEVQVAQELLQALGYKNFAPTVVACPGCGRTTSTVFQELADSIKKNIEKNMPIWRRNYPGVENLEIAVMGCIVNGPGESKHAHIGISLPGTGETPVAPVFIDGVKFATLRGQTIAEDFHNIILSYIKTRYSKPSGSSSVGSFADEQSEFS